MLSNIGNDKAIEFKSELLRTEKMLSSLKIINIDVQKYEKSLELIKEECENSIIFTDNGNSNDFMETATAELAYIKAIGKLRSLQNELDKYNIYFRAYNYVTSVNLSENFSNDVVNKIVDEVSDLLIKINNSDTRFYDAEKEIVEKFYSFVYQVIKLEFKVKGNSNLLALVKNQPVSRNFIEKEVEDEISGLDSTNLNLLVAKLKKQGLDFSYLDEDLLLYLSIQDSKILQDVKETLKKLINEIKKNNCLIKNNNEEKESIEKDLTHFKEKTKGFKLVSSLKLLASLSIIGGLIFGAYKLAKIFSKETYYPTDNQIYSTSEMVQTPLLDGEYKPSIKVDDINFDEIIKVYEYGTWSDKFLGGYKREITTYYLPVINYVDLPDYLSLDLDKLAIKEESTTENKSTLQYEDIYIDMIKEVELVVQDLDNGETFYEDVWLYFLLFIFIYVLICYFLPSFDINISDYVLEFKDDLSDYFTDSKTYKENMLKLKELLEISKKIMEENEECKAEFIKIYEKYAKYLNSKKLDDSYKLVRKKADEI